MLKKRRFSGPYFGNNLGQMKNCRKFLQNHRAKYEKVNLKNSEQLYPIKEALTKSHVSTQEIHNLGSFLESHGGVSNFLDKSVWLLDVSIAARFMAKW